MPKRSPSEFSNLFDLEQREAIAHGFLSFDCNSLRGVVSEFRVDCLLLAHQQISLAVLTLYPDRQAFSNAIFGALSVLWTAPFVGDIAGHIQYFAFDDDFLTLRERTPFALPQIQPDCGNPCQEDDRRCKLQHTRPRSTKWNR